MEEDKDPVDSVLNALEHHKHLESLAEKAYNQMYEVKTLLTFYLKLL